MSNPVVKQILNLVVLLALQVLIFNHVCLFGFLNPNVYVLALLLLPVTMPKSAQYVVAFATGFIVDMFQMTFGAHTSAAMVLVLLRPYLMNLLNVNKKKAEVEVPLPGRKDLKWLTIYTLILVFAHQLVVTMLLTSSFQRFGLTLLSIVLNTAFTGLLVLCAEYLFYSTQKN